MSKKKYNLNTIYISERLQENLKPISQSAFTAVTAPMGYGKTTAINWYLDKQSKNRNSCVIRISIYSDNLSVFWQSVQKAFAFASWSISFFSYPSCNAYRRSQNHCTLPIASLAIFHNILSFKK